MDGSQGLATTQQVTVLSRREVQALEFTDAQRQLIRDAYAKGATDEEFAVLMEIARARALNPLLRQVFFVSRWDSKLRRETWATQVSIDGLRAIAERTGLYAGQDEPEFTENPDGSVKCCRVRVWRKDWPRPAVGVAYFAEYVQKDRDGKPTKFWTQMPHNMTAKCAESLALRKAFPEDTAGLYTPEEMGQADNGAPQRRGRPMLEGGAEARQLPEGHPGATPEASDDEPDALPAPTCADLAGLRAWYVALGLGADDSRRADEASGLAGDHLSALGYLLNSVEHNAALAGTLDAEAATLHDALAMERSAEGVVRVARNFGGLGASDALRKVMCRYYAPRVGLTGKPAADALRKALATPPDGGPSGTRAPQTTPAADATGAPQATAAANDAAQASGPRLVTDGDALDAATREREQALATDAAAWQANLAKHGVDMWAIGPSFAKRAETFRAAGTYDARRRATLDALEHCPYFADRGHADLWLKGREELAAKVRPQVGGEVIPLRNKHARARLAAERTGTTG